jgi:hypothetical protein
MTSQQSTVVGPEKYRIPDAINTDNVEEELNKIPLFMRDLPEDTNDNVALQALQSLVYDGTPEGK